MRRFISGLLCVLLATVAFGAVTAQDSPQSGGTLVVAAESMGDSFDIGFWHGFGGVNVIDSIGEGLVRANFETGEAMPGLAESWTISDDGLVYTFQIREGMTFHDGEVVNAEAVVRSMSRPINPDDPSYLEGMFMYSNQGYENWESIEATGEYEVTLTLQEPNATQLLVLSRPDGAIISPATLDSGDFTNPAMAGPFQLERFVPGQEAVITRFDDYWQEELPYLDQVIIRSYPDEASILAALEADEIDMTLYAPFTAVPRIQEGDENLRIEVGEPLVNLFMGANVENAPLDNTLVRQAVNYAVDREAIIEVALNGLGEAPASILAPNDLGFDASLMEQSTYNPERATELLEASGVELPLEITLSFENNRFWPLMAELIEVDLEAVGFDVTLERLDTGSFWGKANDGELQLSINQRSTFVPDPHGKVTILHSENAPGGQTHHEGLENAEEINALIDAGIATADPAERAEIYTELQAVLLEAAPYTYLAYLTPPIFVVNRVQNVDTAGTAAGRVDFREVWVTDME